MPQSSPEIQPSLPIFPEETVRYVLDRPAKNDAGKYNKPEIVELPVNEIDLMPDPQMRKALWDQFRLRTTEAPESIFVFANADHTYHGVTYVRKGAPTRYHAESGTSNNEQDATESLQELVIKKKTATRRIIERFFGQ